MYSQAQRKRQNYNLIAFGYLVSTSAILNETRGKITCCRLPQCMHMLSRKDLNLTELETVRESRTLKTVVTANGEVQTNEEATVYVCGLDLIVTVQEDTPAVLYLGKLCEVHGYSYEWTSGKKPTWQKIQCNTKNYVPIVVPGLSTGPSRDSSTSTYHRIEGEMTLRHPCPANARK